LLAPPCEPLVLLNVSQEEIRSHDDTIPPHFGRGRSVITAVDDLGSLEIRLLHV
jgi:hypothetical protein